MTLYEKILIGVSIIGLSFFFVQKEYPKLLESVFNKSSSVKYVKYTKDDSLIQYNGITVIYDTNIADTGEVQLENQIVDTVMLNMALKECSECNYSVLCFKDNTIKLCDGDYGRNRDTVTYTSCNGSIRRTRNHRK